MRLVNITLSRDIALNFDNDSGKQRKQAGVRMPRAPKLSPPPVRSPGPELPAFSGDDNDPELSKRIADAKVVYDVFNVVPLFA